MQGKRKGAWTQQEDRILSNFIISTEILNMANIKWSSVSTRLVSHFPEWSRTGRQCRERWINHLNPAIRSQNDIKEQIDLDKFLQCLQKYGRRWSVIGKEFPGKSQNFIKNYFYVSVKKGLRNMNHYNRVVRQQKRYRAFKKQIVDKVLAVKDEKKQQNLFIMSNSVWELSKKIINLLIISSSHKSITEAETEFYEGLHLSLGEFCSQCRFRKQKLNKIKKQEEQRLFFPNFKKCDSNKYEYQQSERHQRSKYQDREVVCQQLEKGEHLEISPLSLSIHLKAEEKLQTESQIRKDGQLNQQSIYDVLNLSANQIGLEF